MLIALSVLSLLLFSAFTWLCNSRTESISASSAAAGSNEESDVGWVFYACFILYSACGGAVFPLFCAYRQTMISAVDLQQAQPPAAVHY